jgi:hypothetical protein
MAIAVYTVGADNMRIKQMHEIADAWGFAGQFMDCRALLNDARKKRFDTVLLIDPEALDDKTKAELATLKIEIIGFKDRKKLEKKVL